MEEGHISKGSGIALIVFAIVFDAIVTLLTFIPFLGWGLSWLINLSAGLFFGLAFSHQGVSLMDSKRALGFIGTIAGEAVPIINGMWWWTLLISYTVVNEWRKQPESSEE